MVYYRHSDFLRQPVRSGADRDAMAGGDHALGRLSFLGRVVAVGLGTLAAVTAARLMDGALPEACQSEKCATL